MSTLPALHHPAHASALTEPLTVVEPRSTWQLVDLFDVWRYRELLWILAVRDIKVRYKQTLIGAAWAILQPVTTMLVFTSLFGLLGRMPVSDGGVPYMVSAFCGLLPWQLFSNALTQASDSLVTNQSLITKVYFPRVIIVLAPILSNLVDFAAGFGILLVLMAWYGIMPGWGILLLPIFLLYAMIAALAGGLWMSAMNALYRDLRYTIPFVVRVAFYVSPVVYETRALIPERYQAVYGINPMVGVLEGFRWSLLDSTELPVTSLVVSAVAVAAALLGGLIYFRRMERQFADRI